MVAADPAYATCLELARAHYENFPVASRLVPAASRHHIAAVYAFARIADDFADEGSRTPEERIALLDGWSDRLRKAARGDVSRDGSTEADVFVALAETLRTCSLDVGLFEDLLSAFRQDVTMRRYETWDDLLDYCRRSANPVGRLVLRIHGYRDAELDARADQVCTALQLANFWQDLERDWRNGRLYVPTELWRTAGAATADLDAGHWTLAWRKALTEAGRRTSDLFEAGRPIADAVHGRLRWELRMTWLGGTRVLERLEQRGFDVFGRRPALGWQDAPTLLWRLAAWRPTRVTHAS